MFRVSMCPSSGEHLLYICDNGICHSVWVASGLLVGVKLQPADQKFLYIQTIGRQHRV